MSDPAALSATEALAAFAAKSLSPREMMEAVIARAEATEPQINAFTETRFDAALDAARAAEARWMGHGQPRGPLEGLPVAIKDSGHIAGWITTGGSHLMPNTPQPTSSAINARVLEAGAICHARSATPEFSSAAVTWSRRHGVSRNPHNLDLTPGGSSGGAAASLAVGSTVLATGSDIGGSIRIPASCCGVVGFKPSKGRCPVDAPFNLDAYCHTGPMARSVADARLFYEVLAGPHPADPTLLPADPLAPPVRDLKGWRVAVSYDLGLFELDPDVLEATRNAVEVFADLGADMWEVGPVFAADVPGAILTHLRALFGTSIAPTEQTDWDAMTSYARDFAAQGLRVTPRELYASHQAAGRAGQDLLAAMGDADILICPTTALPAVGADYDPSGPGPQIGGAEVEPMLGWVMTAPFNMLGYHPVISVSSGRAASGCPIGLQIIGQPYADGSVLNAAACFEAAQGGPWPLALPDQGGENS